MDMQQIDDPIRVLADFSGGAVKPIRFRWAGRSYPVEAVNARWVDRRGDVYALHFSIQSGPETYLLHFDSAEVQWWLDQVVSD